MEDTPRIRMTDDAAGQLRSRNARTLRTRTWSGPIGTRNIDDTMKDSLNLEEVMARIRAEEDDRSRKFRCQGVEHMLSVMEVQENPERYFTTSTIL